MKNKSLTYVLLGVVTIIWYQVFVRVKSNFIEETAIGIDINSPINFQTIQRDTFTLLANYRDPFGSASQLTQNTSQLEQFENAPKPPPPIKAELPWPKITYYGLVRKTESNNPLGIINIDGSLLYLRKGESIYDNIQVLSIGRDSVRVKYDNKIKIFWRK